MRLVRPGAQLDMGSKLPAAARGTHHWARLAPRRVPAVRSLVSLSRPPVYKFRLVSPGSHRGPGVVITSRASPGKIRLDPPANNSCQCLAGPILTSPPTKARAKLSPKWPVTRSELHRMLTPRWWGEAGLADV
jgi:hypothetical protein